jgi:glutamyl-tRNA synthetase
VALLGWSPRGEIAEQEFFTLEELVNAFDITGISKSPAIFDIEKLKHFNSTYIKNLSPEDFFKVAEPYLKEGIKNPDIDLTLVAPLIQTRLDTLTEIPEMLDFFDALPEYSNDLYTHKKMKTNPENSLEALQMVVPVFEAMTEWTFDSIHKALIDLAAEKELKNGRIMWPVRVAASGKPTTPGGAVEICQILGKEETLRRLQKGIAQLG